MPQHNMENNNADNGNTEFNDPLTSNGTPTTERYATNNDSQSEHGTHKHITIQCSGNTDANDNFQTRNTAFEDQYSSSDNSPTSTEPAGYGKAAANDLVNPMASIGLSEFSEMGPSNASVTVPIVGYEIMEERARFTIYKLKVEEHGSGRSWLVFRRYTDFVRLYSRLRDAHPAVALPLPSKRWFRDNFEPAFLDQRIRGLQVFVNSVVQQLPRSPCVRDFLCLDEPPSAYGSRPETRALCGALELALADARRRVARLEGVVAQCDACRRALDA